MPLQKQIYEHCVQSYTKIHKDRHKDKFNHCLLALNNGCLGVESIFKNLYHADHLTHIAFLWRVNFCDCLDYFDVDDY